MAVYKETYKGVGIYWHGKAAYGDENWPYETPCGTLAEARQRIDDYMFVAEEAERVRMLEAGAAVGRQHGDGSITVGDRRFESMQHFRRHAFDEDMPDKIVWV